MPRIKDQGSRIKDQESRIKDQRSRIKGHRTCCDGRSWCGSHAGAGDAPTQSKQDRHCVRAPATTACCPVQGGVVARARKQRPVSRWVCVCARACARARERGLTCIICHTRNILCSFLVPSLGADGGRARCGRGCNHSRAGHVSAQAIDSEHARPLPHHGARITGFES